MKTEAQKFDEQQAPDKNSDKAFVQVGHDGKPLMPQPTTETQNKENEPPKEGTLADR